MLRYAAALALMASALPVTAQVTPTGPTQNRVRVVFTGVVTNDVANTIMIRQPDGTTARYTGPIPDYPYKQGDQVTISFDALAPNRAFYDSSAYTGQRAADGIYDIALIQGAFNPGQNGAVDTVDISGPARQEPFPNTVRGIKLKYNVNTDSYSLAFDDSGWSINGIDTPSYLYNPMTGELTSRNSSCFGVQCEGSGIIITGDENNASIRSGISPSNLGAQPGDIAIGSTAEPGLLAGFFSPLQLSGSFNFGTFGGSSSGGPVDVPEPSTLFLFGGGVAALVARRRKARAKA